MPDNVDDVEHFHSVLVGYVAGLRVHGKFALYFVFAVTDSWWGIVAIITIIASVELAKILFDGTRSKGAGVVQFAQGAFLSIFFLRVWNGRGDAANFQQYMYGGRPLDARYNDRWHTFTPRQQRR
jgi:hypothetical protein